MKHSGLLCVLLLLSLHSLSAARLFISTEPAAGLSGMHKTNVLCEKYGHEGNTEDNPWQLMGMEECNNGDEECDKRRLLSEAHLDYIYTQGHRSKP